MNIKRNLSIVVCATLILSFVSAAISKPIQAKSTRVAVISDITGTATVKSSGGSRQYDAYIDMGLNQGDYITTEDDSSVVLKIKDHRDEVTIGSNSVVSLVSLADKGKGKKSKLKVLSGSLWSNVSKLSGGDDFEIETPTAVMAVRGTKVLTSVNSDSGETYVAVAAGTVSAKTSTADNNNNNNNNNGNNNGNGGGGTVLIAASQQLSLDSRTEVKDLETKVSIIDPQKLVSSSSSNIIEAIVKDKKDIDRENAEFIADQKNKIDRGNNTNISRGDANSSLTVNNLSALDKVSKNLDNLIGNIVKTAIDSNKVDKNKINKVIDEINKTLDDASKKIDLDKVVPLDNTAGVDVSLNKAKAAELAKLEEQKKIATEDQKKKEDEAKQKLAEALKKLEEEKARIAKEKEALGWTTPKPAIKATIAPTPTPTPSPAPVTVVTPSPKPELTTITVDKTNFTQSGKFNLDIGIHNVTDADQVYGVEVHIVYNNSQLHLLPATPAPTSYFFDFNNSSVNIFKPITGLTKDEILYAAVVPLANVTVNGEKTLVNIPILFDSTIGNGDKILSIYVKVINQQGTAIIDTTALPKTITLTAAF